MKSSQITGPSAQPAPPSTDQQIVDDASEIRKGVFLGIAAYGFWGLVPIYFKAVAHVSPWEVVCHRIVWSFVFLLGIVFWKGWWGRITSSLREKKTIAVLSLTTVLITTNWLVFIYSVSSGQVLQASLGYFINPLVNILLGFLFLGERLRPMQQISLLLAIAGVAWMTWQAGLFPWISLVLAFSFGFYGLLRKTAKVGSLDGLTIETMLITPFAVLFVAWSMTQGTASFLSGSTSTDGLLLLAGFVTALPLIWFTAAARRLKYSTMGFLQYIGPTGHFLLAVFVYGEVFTTDRAVGFGLIWSALIVFTIEAWRNSRKR